MANYEDLTVDELKDELRDRDLKVSGRKAELIERLEEDDGAPEEVEEEEVVEEEVEEELELPEFEGLQVTKVLDSRHTKTHFHCKMENGTTKHVPKTLFLN